MSNRPIQSNRDQWSARIGTCIVALLLVIAPATEIFACSVCQGNPDSKLVKGAEAGVLFMVVVTYGLLLSMIGLGATWFVRQRRTLSRAGNGENDVEPPSID